MPALTVSEAVRRDVEAVARLSSVPTILAAMREVTGLRFGVIARVTGTEWAACAVYDELGFGLRPGEPLELATTFCNIVCSTNEIVVMNDATTSERYRDHPTPKAYGFKSYVSVPITFADGRNFGTVCALDRDAANVDDPKVLNALTLFGQLIARQLEGAERERALERAHDALKHRNDQLATFASVASHDLRSPLRGIGNLATWLEDELGDGASPNAREYLSRLKTSVRRMSGLVDGVLHYASAGEDETGADEVNVAHVIDEVSELFSSLDARITSEGADLVVHTRRVPLQHVISNLIDNAVKHAGRGDPAIHVTVSATGGTLHVCVADDGPGIAAEHQERIWRLFQSLDAAPSDERVSGIGLAIVKKLVENEGGEVRVESAPGRGARFHFTWPFVTP